MRFRIAFLCLALSACQPSAEYIAATQQSCAASSSKKGDIERCVYQDAKAKYATGEFSENEHLFDQYYQQRIAIGDDYDAGRITKEEANARIQAAMNQVNQQHQYESINSDIQTDPSFCAGLANMRGDDPNQARLDCIMARRMQNASVAPQQSWQPSCDFASMQAAGSGKDPHQAKMDCLMSQRMDNNYDPTLAYDYNQYQQQRALRQQQRALDEIQRKLNQPTNCTTTYDRWGAHTTCN